MKKFIKKVLLFLIILFVSSLLLQQTIFIIAGEINVGEFGVMNKIVGGEINADILISGTSRAFVGFNPNEINKVTGLKAFNIALNKSRLAIQLPLLKTYLKHNKKPKILIQELGLETLTLDNEVYAPYKYLPYLYEEELFQGLSKIDSDFWMHKYIPLTNLVYFNTFFQKIFFKEIFLTLNEGKDYLKEGFYPHENVWTLNEEEFLKQPRGIYFMHTEEGRKYLLEIIQICSRQNIKLVFVTTPFYYKIKKPLERYGKKMIKTYTEISDRYNVPYLNYIEIPLSKEKKYFYNFTHLAKNGAKEFSNIISRDLIKYNILQSSSEKAFSNHGTYLRKEY